jgi:hypothetical protein
VRNVDLRNGEFAGLDRHAAARESRLMTFDTDARDFDAAVPFPGDDDAPHDSGDGADADAASIEIVKGRTLAEVQANQPQNVIGGRLAVRQNTTALSSVGGTGKTFLTIQAMIEAEFGLPIWGIEDFTPVRPLHCLYVNAEDSQANIDYILGRLLPAYGLDHCPFDLFTIKAKSTSGRRPRFILTSVNATALAQRIVAEGYDLDAFDPAISFLPPGIKFIDPGAIRNFLEDSLGILQYETTAAHLLNHHDNKGGEALSGPADWGNFCRLALHLERGERDGHLTLTTVKSNLGYRFKQITLERDPETGRVTAVELNRYGDRSKQPTSAEEIVRTLAKIVRSEIIPLPSEQRTKWAVIEVLYRKAIEKKLKITKDAIKGFANSHLQYDDRQLGKTKAKIVVGVVEEGAP